MNITRNGFRAFLFIIVDLCIVYGFTRFGSLSMLTKRILVERVITYGSCHQEERPLVQKAISTHAGVIPHYNDTYVIRMWFMLIMYYPYGLFRYIQDHHYTSKFFFLTEKSVRVLHADNMISLEIYL